MHCKDNLYRSALEIARDMALGWLQEKERAREWEMNLCRRRDQQQKAHIAYQCHHSFSPIVSIFCLCVCHD